MAVLSLCNNSAWFQINGLKKESFCAHWCFSSHYAIVVWWDRICISQMDFRKSHHEGLFFIFFIAATFKIDPLCCSCCLHGQFIDNWCQRIVTFMTLFYEPEFFFWTLLQVEQNILSSVPWSLKPENLHLIIIEQATDYSQIKIFQWTWGIFVSIRL